MRRGDSERVWSRPVNGGRTCVVCRTRRSRTELLRLGWQDELQLGRGPGRGAWVCAAASCLERLEQRALARAWRRAPEVGALRPALVRLVGARAKWSTTLQRRNAAMADQAAYWSALWYEIDSLRSGAAAPGAGTWPSGGHGANDDEVA